jgi:hypothetical protein
MAYVKPPTVKLLIDALFAKFNGIEPPADAPLKISNSDAPFTSIEDVKLNEISSRIVPVDVILVLPVVKLTAVFPENTLELFTPVVVVFRSKFGADVITEVVKLGPVEKSRKK